MPVSPRERLMRPAVRVIDLRSDAARRRAVQVHRLMAASAADHTKFVVGAGTSRLIALTVAQGDLVGLRPANSSSAQGGQRAGAVRFVYGGGIQLRMLKCRFRAMPRRPVCANVTDSLRRAVAPRVSDPQSGLLRAPIRVTVSTTLATSSVRVSGTVEPRQHRFVVRSGADRPQRSTSQEFRLIAAQRGFVGHGCQLEVGDAVLQQRLRAGSSGSPRRVMATGTAASAVFQRCGLPLQHE